MDFIYFYFISHFYFLFYLFLDLGLGNSVTSYMITSLLSFIPLSCMVAPNREIVNINPFITSSAVSNLANSNCVSEDIQMGALRGRSTVTSMNLSRELSVLSKASSVEYTACIEAQNNDPSWANQTEDELFQLLYVTSKGEESNIQVLANNKASEPMPHVELAMNTCLQVSVFNSISSSLLYAELQLGNCNDLKLKLRLQLRQRLERS